MINENVLIGLYGFTAFNLILLLAAFISHKVLGLRVSGASVVASIASTWPTSACLFVLFPANTQSKWIVALFMLLVAIIFVVWLRIYQPHDIKKLAFLDLKKIQFTKLDLAKKYKRDKIKEAKNSKNVKEVTRLEKELAEIYKEEKLLKQQYSSLRFFKNIFKKKEVK